MSNNVANPKFLVTGASGFLGSAVVDQLRVQGHDLRTTGRQAMHPATLPNYTAADLHDRAAIAKLAAGVDVVIHAAGLAHQHRTAPSHADEFFQVNARGTQAMALAAASAGCRRFVLVSSVSVYGGGSPPKTETDPCFPSSTYARSKFESEQLASEVAATTGMELIILRMATLYGDNDPGNVGRLLRAIDRGRFIWIGRGQNHKSLVHVDDAASACIAAATERQLPSLRTFNIASAPCSMQTIVTTLATALGRRPSLRLPARMPLTVAAFAGKVPGLANRIHRLQATLEKWLSDDVYDAASFRNAFGWRPTVALHQGLRRQVAQYRFAQQQPPCVNARIHEGGSQLSRTNAA